MRIAQVAPLHESVPPRLYGGTERVVSYLTEALVHNGHDVTLFASGDSRTSARLIAFCDEALRLNPVRLDPVLAHMLMFEQVAARADQFDIIHFHTEYLHLPFLRRLRTPSITTMHGRLDLPLYEALFREYIDIPLVSISNAQRRPIPWANWKGTVHHGLPTEAFRFQPHPGEYLAFTGRISPEKRPDLAIMIARQVGIELRIAAKISDVDRPYFEREIAPLLDGPGVVYLGEIDEAQKVEFLGNALALLFPIDWPEPFGLVMIEAMACGTPVIAFQRGSVPEVIADGVCGFIVRSVEEFAHAVERCRTFDRAQCRRHFEAHFTAPRMMNDYLAIYERQIRGERVTHGGVAHGAVHD